MQLAEEILKDFCPISLQQMNGVRLMNRVDTKYVTTMPMLLRLLCMANGEYMAQDIDGKRNMPYYTCYFDTPLCDMFSAHVHGKASRQKVRLRVYEDSGMAFVEVKTKNNKGRTNKRRTPAERGNELVSYTDFLQDASRYQPDNLVRQVENRFSRITLVNRRMTERLTIDTNLRFNNVNTGVKCALNGLVIIELKRGGNVHSPVQDMLRHLHIHPFGFSKYCVGMALTNHSLRCNRLKPKIHLAGKMCDFLTV